MAWIPFTRSLVVMKAYSWYHRQNSLLEEKDIELSIPGGGEWYPFVMTFCDNEGFSAWMGEDLKLTILYNFPEFDWKYGASRIYDTQSEYYNSFYGAYLVERENGKPYGVNQQGQPVLQEIAEVPKFDFWRLVLADFGISDEERCFEWDVEDVEENVEYVGIDGWTRIRAALTVNGVYHQDHGFVASYLQYGRPHFPAAMRDFTPVKMKGLIYGRYFKEQNVSVFFYCIAGDEELLQKVDREKLSQSLLEMVDFSK